MSLFKKAKNKDDNTSEAEEEAEAYDVSRPFTFADLHPSEGSSIGGSINGNLVLQSVAHSPSHQLHTKPNPPAMEGGSPRGAAAAAHCLFSGNMNQKCSKGGKSFYHFAAWLVPP